MQHMRHTYSQNKALAAAAKMPLLGHHCRRDENFDVMQSDVCRWLIAQPEIRQEIFNFCKHAGAIVFLDGKWVGSTTYAEESARSERANVVVAD
jgi:hypothetical protein